MLDELRQIAIFAKTIAHGSFKGAAQDLRLAPSVVSHHISQLEDKLGVTLIYRSTRKLSLTPDGERLLDAAQIMQEAVAAALTDLRGRAQEPSGVLRVAVVSGLSQSRLMAAVTDFSMRYPKVELRLEFSDTRRHLIDDGFDLSISVGANDAGSAHRKTLFTGDRCLIAASTYLRQNPTIKTPEDLRAHTWVVLSGVRGARPTLLGHTGKSVEIEPRGRLFADSSLAVYRLAKAGAGLAIVPSFLVADERDSALEIVLPDWRLASLDVYAEWNPNAARNATAQLFVKPVCAHFNESTPAP